MWGKTPWATGCPLGQASGFRNGVAWKGRSVVGLGRVLFGAVAQRSGDDAGIAADGGLDDLVEWMRASAPPGTETPKRLASTIVRCTFALFLWRKCFEISLSLYTSPTRMGRGTFPVFLATKVKGESWIQAQL